MQVNNRGGEPGPGRRASGAGAKAGSCAVSTAVAAVTVSSDACPASPASPRSTPALQFDGPQRVWRTPLPSRINASIHCIQVSKWQQEQLKDAGATQYAHIGLHPFSISRGARPRSCEEGFASGLAAGAHASSVLGNMAAVGSFQRCLLTPARGGGNSVPPAAAGCPQVLVLWSVCQARKWLHVCSILQS